MEKIKKRERIKNRDNTKDYIKNPEFYELLVIYQNKCKEAEEKGLQMPRIPDKIGKCFLQIADGLGRRGNFSAYSYLDEMKADGIENCTVAAHSFNPEKGDNPFAYFTQIMWWAFIRRIEKEKKQVYIKHESLVNATIDGTIIEGDDEFFDNAKIQLDNEKMRPIIEKFGKKKKDSKPKNLENYYEDD